ncbi:hypothetical protein SH449x_004457 [Pirellulaceae bacterium SH449]
MTTRTRKSVPSSKKDALPARVARKAVAAKASGLVQSKAIPGLKGKGLLRLGSESKLELRDRLGMSRPLFGRVVNVSERTIAKVESETDTAEKLKRPYNEVYRLLEALGDVAEVDSLGNWFQEPNDAFDGLKPMEVIERGEIDRLWNMVYELRSGMPG